MASWSTHTSGRLYRSLRSSCSWRRLSRSNVQWPTVSAFRRAEDDLLRRMNLLDYQKMATSNTFGMWIVLLWRSPAYRNDKNTRKWFVAELTRWKNDVLVRCRIFVRAFYQVKGLTNTNYVHTDSNEITTARIDPLIDLLTRPLLKVVKLGNQSVIISLRLSHGIHSDECIDHQI